jgi:hypothetical protein
MGNYPSVCMPLRPSPPDPSLLPSRTEQAPPPIMAMPQEIVDMILGYLNREELLMMRLVNQNYQLNTIPFLFTGLTFHGGFIYSQSNYPTKERLVHSLPNDWLLLREFGRGIVDYTDITRVVYELLPLIKNVKTFRFSPGLYRSYANSIAPIPLPWNLMSMGSGIRFVHIPLKQKAEMLADKPAIKTAIKDLMCFMPKLEALDMVPWRIPFSDTGSHRYLNPSALQIYQLISSQGHKEHSFVGTLVV